MAEMIGQINQSVNVIKSAANPSAAFEEMVKNNPNLNDAMSLVKEKGGAKQAVLSILNSNGLDASILGSSFK